MSVKILCENQEVLKSIRKVLSKKNEESLEPMGRIFLVEWHKEA